MREVSDRPLLELDDNPTDLSSVEFPAEFVPDVSGTSFTSLNDPAPDQPLQLSVIVPTRNEADNIAVLLARLGPAIASLSAEIIVVDDSDDDTPQVLALHANGADLAVRLLHRPSGTRRAASAAPWWPAPSGPAATGSWSWMPTCNIHRSWRPCWRGPRFGTTSISWSVRGTPVLGPARASMARRGLPPHPGRPGWPRSSSRGGWPP